MNNEERLDLLNDMLYEKEFTQFKKWLIESEFLNAPASIKYHGAYSGGLFDHSYRVAVTLLKFTEYNALIWQNDRSPKLIGIAHDLCKYDMYCLTDSGNYEHNKTLTDWRHGERSVELLSNFIDLTEEEKLCIKYHMGFTMPQEDWEGYRNAIQKCPNVLWTHHADMLSAFVDNL